MEMKRGLGLVWGGLAVILALGGGLMMGHKLGQSFGDFEVMRDMEPILAENARRISDMGEMIAELQGQVAHAQRYLSESGWATFYGDECAGRLTANGEVFDPDGFTAATWNWPFDTYLRVTSMETQKSVVVRTNDRGPHDRIYKSGVIIDLSRAAAEELGMIMDGRHRVFVVPVLGLVNGGD